MLVWNQKALAAHMLRRPEVSNKFEAMLAADLVKKLRQSRPGVHTSPQNAGVQLSGKRREQARDGRSEEGEHVESSDTARVSEGVPAAPLVYGWHLKN